MIILIPIGGKGLRFKQCGYSRPKALIRVLGKPIIYYLLDNLKLSKIHFVCIPYNKEYLHYNFEEQLKHDYPQIKFLFITLPKDTDGAAETINISLKQFKEADDCPILCLDSDNFYTEDIVTLWNGQNKIFMFEDYEDSSIYSYLKLLEDGKVINIVEKEKISTHASTGAYGFSSFQQLLSYTQRILDSNTKQKGEFYTSTAIREMLKDNISFYSAKILKTNYHCLGTPFQLKLFANQTVETGKPLKPLRFCFDLDNTLVTFPTVRTDYSTVMPIPQNIALLRELKARGHTIIIHTARKMGSNSGSVGKALKDIGKITFDTLESFNIPYDEIYFGKPNADIYIDDLALNVFSNMEKELGFYLDNIKPRDFHCLENASIETVIKSSKSKMSGEIFYYQNIPNPLKHFFPILIDYDSQYHKWIKIEKIDGLTLTELYLQELLTPQTLVKVMESILTLQMFNDIQDFKDVNIYGNYATKLKKRFQTYDYSKFKNYQKTFEQICDHLEIYEKTNQGKKTLIHGDAVMTNILISKNGNIKFIDMRGCQDDKETIFGDWLYDWAKLYQSLIGYDKILQNKQISISYEEKMLETFVTHFIKLFSKSDFENLKMITKSLLFSLIPLHDTLTNQFNEKCLSYYDLIFQIE